MRAFRMTCSVVMGDYLGGDGSHTFDDLTAYLDEKRNTYCSVYIIAMSMGAELQPFNAPRPQLCLTASAMSRLRIMRGNDVLQVCVLVLTTSLSPHLFPNSEVIMKSNANKILLSRLLCKCTLAPNMLMVGEDEGLFNHEEADMLVVSFMIDAARDGKKVIRIISDETHSSSSLSFFGYRK